MSPGISETIGIGCFVLCVSLLAIGANRTAEVKRKPVGWSFLVWWWSASTVGAGAGILIVLSERGWLSSPKGIPWVNRTGYEGVLVEWATSGAVAGLLQAGAIAFRGRLLRGLMWTFSSVLFFAGAGFGLTVFFSSRGFIYWCDMLLYQPVFVASFGALVGGLFAANATFHKVRGSLPAAPTTGDKPTASQAGRWARWRPALIVWPIVVLVSCLFAAPLLDHVNFHFEATDRAQCNHNLRQIARAFLNYHEVHKAFPSAYIPDENGQPMHSWRVLILPFLECRHIYDRYRFSEPWNSPHNLAVTNQPVPAYSCPAAHSLFRGGTETNYMVIAGPNTVFDGVKGCRLSDILDGTSNTILVVEVAGTGVNWGEPKDLNASQLTYPLGTPGGMNPGSYHPGGLHVAYCGGEVHFLTENMHAPTFQAMITKAGDTPAKPPPVRRVP